MSECWTVCFFAFAELLAEVADRAEGFEDFGEGIFFDVGEADAGTVDRLCVAGEVSEFSEFEEFEDGLGFGKATLLDEEISEGAIGISNGFNIQFLRLTGQSADILTNSFVNVNGLLIERDRKFRLF